ncbi:MAG TPA: peptidylprolyl isomerase [Candidatus Pacearchaeota archaeon]|nr:peptidylprolyl isomerase [Candidatus Pacearchaeota archaeon]
MEKENFFPYAILALIIVLTGVFIFSIFSGKDSKNIETGKIAEGMLQSEDKNKKQENMKTLDPSTQKLDPEKKYYAIIKTDLGDIKIEINSKDTPITANNFIYLARQKFYDGVIFHRIVSGFMIQGGDPTGTGSGGPGYKFADEPFTGNYEKGTIAMANAGPDTNGSQFFIMHQDYPLPHDYVIFGKVIEGMDIVDKIATAPAVDNGWGEVSKPVNPVKMNTIEIIEQ